MQSMDRNTVIGFVLLAALLFLYLFLSTKSSQDLQQQKKKQQDSLALIKKTTDSIAFINDTTSKQIVVDTAGLKKANFGTEQLSVVENEVLKITFSNKGGQVKSVELKKYNSAKNGKPVVLSGTAYDKISYSINIAPNQAAQISELFFSPATIVKSSDNSSVLTYKLNGPGGEEIIHQYTLRPNDYLVDWNVQMNGADKLLTQGNFNLVWQSQPMGQEKDVVYERQQTNICFYEDADFDYILSRTEKKFEKPVQWISIAQQFFNTTLIAKNNFNSGDVSWVKETEDSSAIIAKTTASLQAKIPIGTVAAIPMQLYYGPNDYRILKKQAPDMDKIVNLGRDFYAFVRPINKFIVMPVFDFFKNFVASYGLVIAFLTIFIRLLTSPLIYKSYLSGAKMKALKPEIEIMKKRLGNDQQQVGIEQMKLFREAGVNPLGGCIPALLQIPIFFALYSFFNSNIALRGESFLWAGDLSTYDVILKFPFHVWGLGSHLSLFTLLAVSTSFLISIYNMNMTPDQNNPALKYMPYIFPFILLFIFNRLPSALTWYYTVSNVITLIMQWVIQNYIIDHDKILSKIELNRKKPKTKPKWQERFEQMQESQKKLQDTKNKPQRNK
ncbi:MAG: membrane protein insertase YidC [Chitinophagaceae bacterium]|nr:membrane protein insertase YidC [Chitinophagaceae bacterium]